jgi:hypothetical protein
MQSKATTVQQYLASLPPARRAAIQAVREVILKNLDKDFEEGMLYGAIGYYVPHRLFPAGYHCDPSKPLCYAGLGWQKNYMSLGLMTVYGSPEQREWFCAAWARTGKRLDMGKACIRFRKIEDVPLDVIGEAIRRVPAKAYIAHYERSILTRNKAAAQRAARRKAAARPKRGGAKKAAKRRPARVGS